jgi:hypothetical protein
MKITEKQRGRLLFMSGYLDGVLTAERNATGKSEEEYLNDEVYCLILAAIGAIEGVIEQDALLVNTLDYNRNIINI